MNNTEKPIIGDLDPSYYEELPAAYYDEKFAEDASFKRHYTESPYYGLWSVILDRLRLSRERTILEIGCGPGQLAHAIRDAHLADNYRGVDFSKVAVERARDVNPGMEFRCADVFEDRSLEEFPYSVLLTTEFLEHVHEDLSVVERIRPGTMVLGSVPNFPWREHVRHFRRAKEVYDRYIGFFDELYVVAIRMQQQGATHFLFQGQRSS